MLDEAALAVSVTIRSTSCTSRSGPLATYIAARPDLVTATTRRRAGHTRGGCGDEWPLLVLKRIYLIR